VTADPFRATGITAYLRNGGRLEVGQRMAAHRVRPNDRPLRPTSDEISLDEVERIGI
jgi:integrase/recombinase XerD